jgi:hypothetical protein
MKKSFGDEKNLSGSSRKEKNEKRKDIVEELALQLYMHILLK